MLRLAVIAYNYSFLLSVVMCEVSVKQRFIDDKVTVTWTTPSKPSTKRYIEIPHAMLCVCMIYCTVFGTDGTCYSIYTISCISIQL